MRIPICMGAVLASLLFGRVAFGQAVIVLDESLNHQAQLIVPATPGDVGILDPGGGSQKPSDVLRFDNNGLVTLLSDYNPNDRTEEVPPDFADVLNLTTNATILIAENAAGVATYQPVLPTDPGFAHGLPVQPTYVAQSDAEVPEPASLSLLGLGSLGLLARRRK